MRHDLLLTGTFPTLAQDLIDTEFRCRSLADIDGGQEQLIEAWSRGVHADAALDVFANEPDIDLRFSSLDNVVPALHIGSATIETRLAMARLTLDNLFRFFADGTALTPVNVAPQG